MSKNEKILLLQIILENIRGNWGSNLDERVKKALEFAKELKLNTHIYSINNYIKDCKEGYNDGRFFRKSYKNGGYENMEKLHGLKKTIKDKSKEFKKEVATILIYPEDRFVDYEKYYK